MITNVHYQLGSFRSFNVFSKIDGFERNVITGFINYQPSTLLLILLYDRSVNPKNVCDH